MKYVDGGLIKNTLISQFSELTADLVSGIIYYKFGPRFAFTIMFCISIFGSILLMLFWTNLELIPVLIILAKFGISASFNMVFIASVQLIPTIVAASVFGYCNVSARLITVLSPIVAELDYPLPLYINIGAAMGAAFTSLFII